MEIQVTGAKILYTLPFLGGIKITESVVNAWLLILLVIVACKWMTKNLSVENPGTPQIIAEKAVIFVRNLVQQNMGENWMHMAPLIGTILVFSFGCSVMGIAGLHTPTGDFSVTRAMAIVVFVYIEYYNLKFKGLLGFFTRFTEPLFILTPLNVVSEFSTPLSMSMRHFGNIASGAIISSLLYAALAVLSKLILGWIPVDFIANIPIFQIGIPAILSIYFDVFSSGIQAYIFCMLTMANVAGTAD